MSLSLKHALALLLVLIVQPALAADTAKPTPLPTIITLENGAKVQLNADFTWEYVFSVPQTKADIAATTGVAASTSGVIDNALSADAISQAELLKTTAKNGVTVSFIDSQWDSKGRLGLNFALTSTSQESYVEIELEIRLFDDSGQQLSEHKVDVWQAIFRLPDTYLRPGQTRKSDTIWLEGIDKNRWQQQLMTMKIIDMSSR